MTEQTALVQVLCKVKLNEEFFCFAALLSAYGNKTEVLIP